MKMLLLFYPFIILLFLSSCKKKSSIVPAPASTISATVDGEILNFNSNVTAKLSGSGGVAGNVLEITATTTDNSEEIILTVISTHTITTGTYNISNISLTTSYLSDAAYIEFDKRSSPQDISKTDVNGAHPTTITITAISSNNVHGTFNGTLISPSSSTVIKTVTNGKFNVAIK